MSERLNGAGSVGHPQLYPKVSEGSAEAAQRERWGSTNSTPGSELIVFINSTAPFRCPDLSHRRETCWHLFSRGSELGRICRECGSSEKRLVSGMQAAGSTRPMCSAWSTEAERGLGAPDREADRWGGEDPLKGVRSVGLPRASPVHGSAQLEPFAQQGSWGPFATLHQVCVAAKQQHELGSQNQPGRMRPQNPGNGEDGKQCSCSRVWDKAKGTVLLLKMHSTTRLSFWDRKG